MPGDDRLGGLVVVLDPEGRVLLHQFVQGDGELLLIGRRLGLDRQADDRLIKIDRFEKNGVRLIADRIARRDLLEPHDGDDVAGARLFHPLPFVCMHLQKPGDLLLLPAARIVEFVPRMEASRIDPEIGQFPPLILHDLEGQGRQGLLVAARPGLLLLRQRD